MWDTEREEENHPTLGYMNSYERDDQIYIQAHPANKNFTNIGEIGMVFCKSAYYEAGQDPYLLGVIGYSSEADEEREVLINLADPNFQRLFKYLTVFDPTRDGIDNNGDDAIDNGQVEWKIPGRININTAPWYVIAQLPWVSERAGGYSNKYELARAIVAYRDKLESPVDYSGPNGRFNAINDEGGFADWFDETDIREARGFENIGELNFVIDDDRGDDYSMRYYALDSGDLDGFPDLTSADGAIDDFEERDVIFARISNLVTVRSDVFTAYILVRIGTDGPQKRVIAILDRSDVYPTGGKVKIRALHPVPDPR